MTITMRAGETLGGKYVLEQLLGKGGMGAVWSAYDTETQQKFAVKVILPQLEEELTKELRQRLLREAGACAKLQHPNVIQVHEVGETDQGHTFMVLELLDGQPLGDVLKQKRRLDPKLAARIAADIASGLSEAHAGKVIHRDLKPANIFLHREPGMGEDEFVTKVLDFGVCIDREAMDTVKTRAGIIVGSPAYMSPEQVAMRKDIDGRTDVWSLGLILYEMITGMRVFNGNVQNVMAQIITQPVPAPSSKVRDVPPDLDAVVARCTQVKKELRYAEAGELARDLYVIAGVRQPARQPSRSRSSIVRPKQIGLVESYEPEILATPAVAQRGSAPTFNPSGATLPLVTAERRAEVDKLPLVMEENEDLAATLPLQAAHLVSARPAPIAEVRAAQEREAALGTQFLRPDAPILSPAPAWKQDMERALEEHRRSSHSLPLFDPEAQAKLAEISQSVDAASLPDVAAGTQMLPPSMQPMQWVRPEVPLRSDATGTTSVAGAMTQEVIRSTLKSQPDPTGVTGRRKRRGSLGFSIAAAFLGSAIVLLVGVVVLQKRAQKNQETADAAAGSSASLPFSPVKSDAMDSAGSVQAPAPPPVVAPRASAADVAPVASEKAVTNPPTGTTVPTGLAAPTSTNPYGAPATTTPVPVKTGSPSKKSLPLGTPTKKSPPKDKCIGVGVFQRCTKVP